MGQHLGRSLEQATPRKVNNCCPQATPWGFTTTLTASRAKPQLEVKVVLLDGAQP